MAILINLEQGLDMVQKQENIMGLQVHRVGYLYIVTGGGEDLATDIIMQEFLRLMKVRLFMMKYHSKEKVMAITIHSIE